VGDKPNLVVALNGLGELALDGGDPVAARARYAEALTITQGYGQVGNLAAALEGLAGVAAAAAPAHALRLAGAAARLREDAAIPIPADAQASLDRWLAPARAALGAAAQEAAGREGWALSRDEAVAAALGAPESPPDLAADEGSDGRLPARSRPPAPRPPPA
jgi:hypothetical protein